MKKILNQPFTYVDEMLEGLCAAHPDYYRQIGDDGRVIALQNIPVKGKVGIVSGGGSGHLPVFTGYVGKGLLDSCAIGDVFSSPNVDQMINAIKSAHSGEGVLLLYCNYSGDRMNFDMASEMVEREDIKTRTLLVHDDVASAGPEEKEKRRGIAGIVYAYKIAGAKAAQMANLDEITAVTRKVIDATRTIGVALTPCVVPAAGRPTFELAGDEMEIGMGIHGEPGVRRGKLLTADEIAEEMLNLIIADMPLHRGARVSVLLNSLGATPLEELYIVYRYVAKKLHELGITIVMPLVGRFATSMEMTGLSVTICQLDETLEILLKEPCDCPNWRI